MSMRTTRPRGGWTRVDNEIVTRGVWASLSDIECRVFIALLVHVNERRECWPSLKTLGRETGRHWTAISGAVHRLAKRGLTTIRGATGKSNVYDLRTWVEIAQALREAKTFSPGAKATSPTLSAGTKGTFSAGTKGTFSASANRSRYIEVDPSEIEAALRQRKPTPGTSSSSRPGDGREMVGSLPVGFEGWLRHLNQSFGLVPPKGYTPGSSTGRRLAAQYAKLRSRFSEGDLLRVVDISAGKAARGFKAAAFPNVMLGRAEEFLAEQEARPRGHGRPFVSREGAEHQAHLEAMRRVVER